MVQGEEGSSATPAFAPPARWPVNVFGIARWALVALLLFLVVLGPGVTALFATWQMPLIGVGGALVANATGIGGGIVFVPAFDRFGLNSEDIVGTSLLIQSFGMSMGALTYLSRRRKRRRADSLDSSSYILILALTVPPAVLTCWLATFGGFRPDLPLTTIFKAISLVLVALIILSEFLPKPDIVGRQLAWGRDAPLLVIVGVIGGFFVGWISIGVGELLAVYLLLRGARGSDAVGLAVIATALTVVIFGGSTGYTLPTDVNTALLVAPGALLGGFLAPFVLALVGQARVKWFCATFIVLSSLAV